MSETPKQSPQEEVIAELVKHECMEKNHSLLGHGTLGKDIAEKILRDGIMVNPAYALWSIAKPLSENAAEAAKDICHWGHKNAKFIIVLSLLSKENLSR